MVVVRPVVVLIGNFVMNFSGALNNVFVFPFRYLFWALAKLWRGFYFCGQVFGWVFRSFRAFLGGGRSAGKC
eukprot:SAG31_NODE_44539_length_262_cov_0.932515_1_plen_71_part_10